MEQCKIKILWIDDEINCPKLRPYLDEFEDNDFEIIKAPNPDDVESAIASHRDIQCIIVDILMATGTRIDVNESKKGMLTGLFVLQTLNNSIKKVVFTIRSNDEVRKYCESEQIPYLKKQDYIASTFVAEIKKIIKGQ